MSDSLDLPAEYASLLADIRRRVQLSRTRAWMSVNAELIALYWEVGRLVDERQRREGWGARVIPRLSHDLRSDFPDETGFSERNIKRMLAFYREYAGTELVPQAVASPPGSRGRADADDLVPQAVALVPAALLVAVPWGHHDLLMARVKDLGTRAWYMRASVENGWSRAVLLAQIQSGAHARAGQAVTNFALRLTPPDSDLAQQALKDPYLFDFLTLSDDFRERELEAGLLAHLERFLIELGQGFAFVGRQYHLKFRDRDLFLDLLFYHLTLRRYVVVEIKRGEFQPEHVGKVNLYCNLVDDQLRHEGDGPTIGLILCQEPDRLFAEYTLRGVETPIGVSSYEVTRSLPTDLQTSLPTVEDIERELQDGGDA